MVTTETDTLLGRVARHPEAEEFLAWPGDFEPSRRGHGTRGLALPSGVPLEPVAGDGGGGTYYQVGDLAEGDGRPVLYVSAEGEAGLVAGSLREALELVVGLPYWQDCLPGRGLPVTDLEADYRRVFADLDGRRDRVAALLGLGRPPTAELISRLHASVARTAPGHVPCDAAGTPYPPLG